MSRRFDLKLGDCTRLHHLGCGAEATIMTKPCHHEFVSPMVHVGNAATEK